MRRQELDEAFSAPVATLIAPPETGKTFTFTKQLLRIPAQILAVMPTVTAGKESVAALHCAWTRCATTLMLERFCDEMNTADVQSGKLVIVFVGNDKEIYLTAHQKKCVTLWELKGEQQITSLVMFDCSVFHTQLFAAGSSPAGYCPLVCEFFIPAPLARLSQDG